ncbi:hypothetical protein OEZ85_002583 [Tetradesmus obliquus]|uniref:Uncharacterized protein n=1 Tax=Tetradesmus obliquus TaxID=3088 RepID=A0ABY8TXZ2_TETOB|nr:hypothetical protein OEZ85_002583 [Tetradesmus obliquus]
MHCARSISPARSSRCASQSRVVMRPQAPITMQYTPGDQGQAVSPAAAPAAAGDSQQHQPRYYEEELCRLRTWKARQSRFCVEALARSSTSGGSDH